MKLLNALSSPSPLLIEPGVLKSYAENAKAVIGDMKSRDPQPGIFAYYFGKRPEPEIIDGVAVIPVKGIIGKDLPDVEIDLGAIDLNDLNEWLDEAEADPQVRAVLLDIASPGGTGTGVPEVAARIASFPKPVFAFTDSQAASAAYWIASAALEVLATPSSSVGSIGVYLAFPDVSAALRQQGVTMEVIKSGDLKAAGYPGTTLSPEQRANLQAAVDGFHADFKSAVTSRRTLVSEDSMRGQSFGGKEAASRGLVTGLVASKSEAIARLTALRGEITRVG